MMLPVHPAYVAFSSSPSKQSLIPSHRNKDGICLPSRQGNNSVKQNKIIQDWNFNDAYMDHCSKMKSVKLSEGVMQ